MTSRSRTTFAALILVLTALLGTAFQNHPVRAQTNQNEIQTYTVPPTETVDYRFTSRSKSLSRQNVSWPGADVEELLLRLEIADTQIVVGEPFEIVLKVYDKFGLPIPMFSDVVTFECANGITPVLSRQKWKHARFSDSVVILKPGRNIRLSAMSGDAIASQHIDVMSELPSKQMWLEIAQQYVAQSKFQRAIEAYKRATVFDPDIDPIIERKIGKLYLRQGDWRQAERHFQRAITSVFKDS
ncbi:MAG: tetratricopeptide repeat protein [Candidatus Lindowbacteria bacterium]|nr:tetratricopeptide repeat protein [Candidatus Lindowbacteria bacterium]